MIIAIDASRAVRPQPTGTELYSARLIEYLAKIDHHNTYYLYTPVEPTGRLARLPKNFIWKVIPLARLWTHLRLSLALLIDKPDVLFVPAHVLPFFNPVKKTVITIHDIASEVFPEMYSWFQRWYFRLTTRLIARHVSAVITPSHSTKQDLIRIFQIASPKITVIWLGYDADRFTKRPVIAAEIRKLQPYFVMIGRLERRKNTLGAITAFAAMRQQHQDIKAKLVLIGKPGYGYEDIAQAIEQLPVPIKTDIVQLGYIGDDEVVEYLSGATAFLYPSLYEGFGVPILEAMATGTPVITSDVSSNPEVADDAAVFVQPTDTAELARLMALFADDELSRNEIIKKGKERINEFSWEKMARQTLEVIEKVGER